MTAVLDEHTNAATTPIPPEAPSRGHARARWRVDLRLARRQVWRAKGSSALVVVLVAMPMALLSGGAVFWASHVPTQEETLTAELGLTDAWLQIVGGYDPTRAQSADDPWWVTVERDDSEVPVNSPQPPPPSPVPFLPNGVQTIEIGDAVVTVETAGGIGQLSAVIGDAGDPALTGRFDLVAGRAPTSTREAMISPGAATRLRIGIGDTLTLTDPAASFTVTGLLTRATDPDSASVVFLPAIPGMLEAQNPTWFVVDWHPTIEDLPALNHAGIVVYSRHMIEQSAGSGQAAMPPSAVWSFIVVVGAVAGFCGYLVVLLAGAAFSVSARRQQRSLAVAASVGASRADLFRIVLLQGATLGAFGGVVGAAAGIGAGLVALHIFDDGSTASLWGVHIPWSGIVGIVAFALAIGTASALLPARAATRGDVLSALRGARKPVRVRVDRPFWGALLLALGIGLTVVGGATLASLNAVETVDYANPLRTVAAFGIIAGPLLFQVGVLIAGHWILSVLSRGLSRLGLTPRLAGRDAAANPGRIVPAFGAIASCAFLASAAIGGVGVNMASIDRNWSYQAPLGDAYVSVWSDGTTDAEAAVLVEGARGALARTAPDATAEVRQQPWPVSDPQTGEPLDLDTPVFAVQVQRFTECGAVPVPDCMPAWLAANGSTYELAVVKTDELSTALGVPVSDRDLVAFEGGAAIVTDPTWLTASDKVVVNEWTWADQQDPRPDRLRPRGTATLDGVLVRPPHPQDAGVIVTPATAARLGIATRTTKLIGSFDTPPAQSTLDALQEDVSRTWSAGGGLGSGLEGGPPAPAMWLWLILGATAALVVGAGSVALGLARVERRPDDATLTAIGATRAVRRGIAFWQAAIVTGIGCLTGSVAGVLPVWGVVMISQGSNSPTMADVPWVWLALLGFALPTAIAVASWLVPPRDSDLTRRTAIA